MIRALLGYAGYWVRPYDMLADRRRWFWQKQQRCGLPPMPGAMRDQFMEAVRAAAVHGARCHVPPDGWVCTRQPGHSGPCAAWPVEQQEGQ